MILVGNLTRDLELKYTPAGKPVTTLRPAVTTKSGEKEEVLFIDCVVFGKPAELCCEYLRKGSPVLIEGRLQERTWEYGGQTHRKMEVLAQAVRFLGKKEPEE